ncbi:MAG: ComF family protein [Bacteroidales bacterium]|nr:ComF family protein [Lentimicrobiaceae bacterium]MDD5694170.1 ComF family protein [Bacteroidales bacterium]
MNLFRDFVGLVFPEVCAACGNPLVLNENMICSSCLLHLPRTHFSQERDNPVSQVFWGKAEVFSATALFLFKKGSGVQHLLHQLKYNGNREIGLYLGALLGDELRVSELFNSIEVVVPVPLHPRKQRKRGYNQSEVIAEGICRTLPASVDTQTLVRVHYSDTQTKKSRYKRWENVKDIFSITSECHLAEKHVLLVDDVLTTGSTMEACAGALLKIPRLTLSIACIAFATH